MTTTLFSRIKNTGKYWSQAHDEIHVIFPIFDFQYHYIGVMQLAEQLRQKGFQVFFSRMEVSEIKNKLSKEGLNVICYTVTAPLYKFYRNFHINLVTTFGKSHKMLSFFGGPHASHVPKIIENIGVDVVIRFDGDLALGEILDRFREGRSPETTPGIIACINKGIIDNGTTELFEDLDCLPVINRRFYEHQLGTKNPYATAIASRGCLYSCAYCHNHLMNKHFQKNGKRFFRHQTVDSFILECEAIKNGGYSLIDFCDDIFNFDKSWLESFSKKYEKQIRLPFQCNLRAELVDKDVAEFLKRAGCKCVSFGLETGNARLKKTQLGRTGKLSTLNRSIEICKKNHFKIITTNIFAIPGSSFEDELCTIKSNIDLKPDYAYSQLLQPYPGTSVTKSSTNIFRRYYEEEDHEIYMDSPLIEDRKDGKQIRNLALLLQTFVSMPFLIKIARLLAYAPFSPVYQLLYNMNFHMLKNKKIRNLTWGQTFNRLLKKS